MRSRFMLYTAVATLLVGGFAFVADALVISDEEQLGELVAELTEAEPGSRVDGVLRWVDLSREPLAVRHDGQTRRFEDDEGYAVSDAMADALDPFEASDLDVVQRSVRVDGDRGTVAVRVRAGGDVHDATLHLTRSGQGWLVQRVQAR